MSNVENAINIGNLTQGVKDVNSGIKSNDAGDALNAISQGIAGIY